MPYEYIILHHGNVDPQQAAGALEYIHSVVVVLPIPCWGKFWGKFRQAQALAHDVFASLSKHVPGTGIINNLANNIILQKLAVREAGNSNNTTGGRDEDDDVCES